MPLPGLSQDEMRVALSQLEQALFHHDLWFEGINRTLICGQAPDQRDAAEDAHRNCRFGQWLYRAGADAGALAKHPLLRPSKSRICACIRAYEP